MCPLRRLRGARTVDWNIDLVVHPHLLRAARGEPDPPPRPRPHEPPLLPGPHAPSRSSPSSAPSSSAPVSPPTSSASSSPSSASSPTRRPRGAPSAASSATKKTGPPHVARRVTVICFPPRPPDAPGTPYLPRCTSSREGAQRLKPASASADSNSNTRRGQSFEEPFGIARASRTHREFVHALYVSTRRRQSRGGRVQSPGRGPCGAERGRSRRTRSWNAPPHGSGKVLGPGRGGAERVGRGRRGTHRQTSPRYGSAARPGHPPGAVDGGGRPCERPARARPTLARCVGAEGLPRSRPPSQRRSATRSSVGNKGRRSSSCRDRGVDGRPDRDILARARTPAT